MSALSELLAARNLILEPEMWAKGTYGPLGHGPMCAVGAIMRAGEYQYIPDAEHSEATEALAAALPMEWRSGKAWFDVEVFNDDEFTEHRDIIALFDRAIEAVSE